MPLYTFENLETGEVWEEFCSISSMQEKIQDSNIKQIIFAPAIVSGVQGLSYRTDGGFNDVLSKVAEAHPDSELADRTLKRGVKEVKTRQAVSKHRK